MESTDVEERPTHGKKRKETISNQESSDKNESPKKSDKKRLSNETEEPKPRIVLTFRPEKPGVKSSNMKIVSTEEKHDEVSPRRSTRARGIESELQEEDNENSTSPQKGKSSENEDHSEPTPLKRSTRRRSKEFSDNVLANAIARKEKSYNESIPQTTRLSRRIKPTAKILANKELRIGIERCSISRLGAANEEAGIQTRRSARRKSVEDTTQAEEVPFDKTKKRHLGNLGLKGVIDDDQNTSNSGDQQMEEVTNSTLDDDEEVEVEEILEEGSDIQELSSEDEFVLDSVHHEPGAVRRSLRKGYEKSRGERRSTHARHAPDDEDNELSENMAESEDEGDDTALRRRSLRKRKMICYDSDDYEQMHHTTDEPNSPEESEDAVRPEDETRVIGTCFCETPSNVYADPNQLKDPVFCDAVETIEGARVGCSHAARREQDGSVAAMLRAGPRSPYTLACKLHANQLLKHMCCPTCAMFCSQGIFYQCSEGHLFHLDCGLPFNSTKTPPGCPHCGLYSYCWLPVNTNCYKVKVEMKCSNKRIFLPEQREQCTQAYLTFSKVPSDLILTEPIVPEAMLPSITVDMKKLKVDTDFDDFIIKTNPEVLCQAIIDGADCNDLLDMISTSGDVNMLQENLNGGTYLHTAARYGNLTATYMLHYAGAKLDQADYSLKTPLITAITALVNKTEKPNSVKSDDIDKTSEGDTKLVIDEETKETDVEVKDEDLLKVIRYLVAAGCNVNFSGPEGMTALHIAAQNGNMDVCNVLMTSSATEIDSRDVGGWTPLVWAAENGHVNVVRLLLSRGADANTLDKEGNSAMHWCVLCGQADILRELIDAKPPADINAQNPHGDTPLHVAARQGHYPCVVILLARGAKTDIMNKSDILAVEACTGECQSAIYVNMQIARAMETANKKNNHVLCSDISNGKELYPIQCVNDVDDTPAPTDYTYVTQHVTSQHIYIDNTIASMQGCECKELDCSESSCGCSVLGVKRWYKQGRLANNFPYHEPPMLFECNFTCSCAPKLCANQVVTRASTAGSMLVRAQVFRCTGNRGWGLRCTTAVLRGTPVAIYYGELLSMNVADTRNLDLYMFSLDLKPDLIEQCEDKTQLCVDAARYGSAARFINHSCRPNLTPVRVFTTTRDLRLPTIVLFATRDIKAMEEITFDYGEKFWNVKSKYMACECGTTVCRYPNKVTDEEMDIE